MSLEHHGILIRTSNSKECPSVLHDLLAHAEMLGIARYILSSRADDGLSIRLQAQPILSEVCTSKFDTLQLSAKLQFSSMDSPEALEKEILLSMLLSPVAFEYPSYAEFSAALRIRKNIVEAARLSALCFDTKKIERPPEFWNYAEERGFTLRPGKSLIEALRMATQPEISGQCYSFSCYRATEYVYALGIALELSVSNPLLLDQLQRHCESWAIMSRNFHETFLREYGSMDEPLPSRYYVPGDRVWFRNPDERSSDVEGYEGSWVIYLGDGLFNNFWKQGQPYTLTEKCVEVYHWRSGVYEDTLGILHMDEDIVEARKRATLGDPTELKQVLDRTMRLRDPSGTYANGGCIDTTREYPRWVCAGTSDIFLPNTQ